MAFGYSAVFQNSAGTTIPYTTTVERLAGTQPLSKRQRENTPSYRVQWINVFKQFQVQVVQRTLHLRSDEKSDKAVLL